jgi:flagella basal body P-ring formation protein FlgA
MGMAIRSREQPRICRLIPRFGRARAGYHGHIRREPTMKRTLLTAILMLSATLGAAAAQAVAQQPAAPARQDLGAVRQAVEQFLQTQTVGLPGAVTVNVGAIDQRMALAPCPQLQAFFMPGARAWGKTTVGVRCAAPSAWTVYIQANVTVQADYVASAVPLAQGQPIEAGQLVLVKGDLTTLPAGIATDIGQVVGRSAGVSLAAGTPMRLDTLRSKQVITAGQLVRVVSGGAGFRVSAEARAVAAASEGQIVQVRTAGGQQVSGVAKAGGLVEVAF